MTKVNEEVVVEEEFDGAVVPTNYDVKAAIAGLNDRDSSGYSSIKGSDFASKKLIASAQTKSVPLSDNLDTVIPLRHIIVQSVQIADENTGAVNEAPRVLLIAEDGKAYHATSVGVLGAVRNIINTLGEPDEWPEAVDVRAYEQRGRNRYRFLTLEVI